MDHPHKRGDGKDPVRRDITSMDRPPDQRSHNPSSISASLESGFKHICRASFLIVTMLVKRVFWRSYLEEAIWHLTEAQKKLGELDGRSQRPRK